MKLVCVFVLLLISFTSTFAQFVGGYSPIKDINAPHVRKIAQFAITEHNKHTGENLKLERVIKGDSQVVSGLNYRLTLAATDGSTSHNYLVIVYEQSWTHTIELTSFSRINH
uniref:Cystatin domain-containing protein n=1 Tax=Lotus japonicus TaxID=34305 RepID=I3SL29_LOTJA|nr:unknown [Lotus japonicus]